MPHVCWAAGLLLLVTLGGLATPAQAAGPIGPGDRATLVLLNGRIYTGDPARPWVEAIALGGERILAIGTTERIRTTHVEARSAHSGPRVIDLHGHLVIPGINDAHLHSPDAWHRAELPLNGNDPTLEQLAAALSSTVAQEPSGAWIHGPLGVDSIDNAKSLRAALDRLAPNHPVWLDNFAGHITLVNAAAQRVLGISDQQGDPPGGIYEKDSTGRFNGFLFEYARWREQAGISAAIGDSALLAEIEAFSREAAAYGVTSVQDMPIRVPSEHLAELVRRHRMPIRWRFMRFPLDGPDTRAFSGWAADRVTLSGTKYILDGTPIERGAAMIRPYNDRAGWSGRLNFAPSDIASMLRAALENHDQILLHCAGDSVPRLVLKLMATQGEARAWPLLRPRMEHGDGLTPDLYRAARRYGIVVVQNPSHLTQTVLMPKRYGRALDHMFALRSLIAAGIPVALGSDGPLNPYLNIMFAVTHPLHPEEAITRGQAVDAYTRGSAYAEFMEKDKGRLVPGMLGDLAVLSQDIFRVPVEALPATHSLLTVVGGEIVYEASSGW